MQRVAPGRLQEAVDRSIRAHASALGAAAACGAAHDDLCELELGVAVRSGSTRRRGEDFLTFCSLAAAIAVAIATFELILGCRDRVRLTSKIIFRPGTSSIATSPLRTRRAAPGTIAMMSKRAQTKG